MCLNERLIILNLKGISMKNLGKVILGLFFVATLPTTLSAQADGADVEEVVVTGTQIKGARINEALPVTVITSDDIDDRGVNSGDELLATLTEQGVNQFNDVGSNGGGVKDLNIDLVTSGKMSVKEFLEKAEANIRKGMKDRSFKPNLLLILKGNVTKNS